MKKLKINGDNKKDIKKGIWGNLKGNSGYVTYYCISTEELYVSHYLY